MKISKVAILFLVYVTISEIDSTQLTKFTAVVLKDSGIVASALANIKYIDFKCGIKYCDNTKQNCLLYDKDITDLHPSNKLEYLYQYGSGWTDQPATLPPYNKKFGVYTPLFISLFENIFSLGKTAETEILINSKLRMVVQAIIHNFVYLRKTEGKSILYKVDVRVVFLVGGAALTYSDLEDTIKASAGVGTGLVAPFWVTDNTTTLGFEISGAINKCLKIGATKIFKTVNPFLASGILAEDSVESLDISETDLAECTTA